MTSFDHVLAGLLTILSLALAFARIPEDLDPRLRRSFYLQGALTGLILGVSVLLAWHVAGRRLDTIGLFGWWGDAAGAVLIAAALWTCLLLVAVRLIANGLWRQPLRIAYRRLAFIMPQSRSDLRASWFTSVIAGAGEEIAYRGFLLWYFASLAGLPAAVAASTLIFGSAHGYQRLRGILYAASAGLLLALAALASGSLVLVIWMHAGWNMASFAVGRILLREDGADGGT
jgi:membrane protease YdiL (CAAX protease family)